MITLFILVHRPRLNLIIIAGDLHDSHIAIILDLRWRLGKSTIFRDEHDEEPILLHPRRHLILQGVVGKLESAHELVVSRADLEVSFVVHEHDRFVLSRPRKIRLENVSRRSLRPVQLGFDGGW
ncbi:hypothetical protein YC2023_088600 [Brassica napus]